MGRARTDRGIGVSRRMKPDPGQKCECSGHDPGEPHENLTRVFQNERGTFCYLWWCRPCCESHEVGEMEDGWPTGPDGRFLAAVHCSTVPGEECRG